MDLLTSITTGSGASLVMAMVLLPIWNFYTRRFDATKEGAWRVMTIRGEVVYLSWHMLAGAAQGLLFWLTWGFAALNMTSWWTHGIIVGLAYALLLILPMLGITTAITKISRTTGIVLMTEMLLTSMIVGMACSWNWMHVR